jgi:hypothetical protein
MISICYKSYESGQVWKKMKTKMNIYYCIINEGFSHMHLFHSKNISFRWPNYIVTLPIYFSFRLPHLNINTGAPSDELDKNIQRKSHFLLFSHWNGYNHFRFALDFISSHGEYSYYGSVFIAFEIFPNHSYC